MDLISPEDVKKQLSDTFDNWEKKQSGKAFAEWPRYDASGFCNLI